MSAWSIPEWQYVRGKNIDATACNCIGPQNSEPLCPCAMRDMQIVNGRYQKVIDYGPAQDRVDVRTYGPPHKDIEVKWTRTTGLRWALYGQIGMPVLEQEWVSDNGAVEWRIVSTAPTPL